MPPILGHIIVIAILAVPVYFAGRYCLRDIRGSLTGGGCGGCSGDCSSCGGSCSCGGNRPEGKTEIKGKEAVKKGPTRYAINGKIVIIPGTEDSETTKSTG